MKQKIFVAGAAGAIGAALVPLLLDAGYAVYGSTRSAERAALLQAKGVTPVLVDVFDAAALCAALAGIMPVAVVHQLTDLPARLDPALMAAAGVRNARIRDEGTRNLIAATRAAGCTRMLAQSIAWAYAPGAKPHTEDDPLDLAAEGGRGISVGGVAALERQVLATPGLVGTVLRYGQLHGPGTAYAVPTGAMPVHVEAAAWAALLALQRDAVGIFNVTESDAEVSSAKARRELGWSAALRLSPQGSA